MRCGLWLVEDAGVRSAMLLWLPPNHGPKGPRVRVEILGEDAAAASATLAELRRLALDHNVYRGCVVGFGEDVFGGQAGDLRFVVRPELGADELVLPDGVIDLVERQVLGVADTAPRFTLPSTSSVASCCTARPVPVGPRPCAISWRAWRARPLSCCPAAHFRRSARLAPSLGPCSRRRSSSRTSMCGVHIDDESGRSVGAGPGRSPRARRAVTIPLPDLDGRRRLLDLYCRGMELRAETGPVLERTAGMTASFLKELLQRAALASADESDQTDGRALVVQQHHLMAALDELLDDRHQLTRAVIGGGLGSDSAYR